MTCNVAVNVLTMQSPTIEVLTYISAIVAVDTTQKGEMIGIRTNFHCYGHNVIQVWDTALSMWKYRSIWSFGVAIGDKQVHGMYVEGSN